MGVPILGQPKPENVEPQVVQLDSSGPQVRILYCFNCKTIEDIPDYEGHPDDDTLLEIVLEKHTSAGVPHTGHMFKVAAKLWFVDSVRKEIIKQIRSGSGGMDELDPGFYDTRNTFFEDAMKCYGDHLRPKGACPDFRTDKKRLLPQTDALRKEAGLDKVKNSASRVYLCDFCPVKSFYMQKSRLEAGVYDK